MNKNRPLFLLAAILGLVTSSALAATVTWTGTSGNGLYATGGNWSGGVAPANNDYQDTALFNTGARTVTVPSSQKVAGLNFQTPGWTLATGSFAELTSISSAGSGTNTLNVGITAHANATWTVGSGNTLVFGSSFYQRDKNITLTGGGQLRFNASIGGYTGTAGAWGIHISSGRVVIDAATPYQSGTGGAIFINGADASLELQATMAAAESLVSAGRIVDQLGNGLAIEDIGGGIVRIVSVAGDPVPPVAGNWQLQFQDDFDGTSLDGTKWHLGQHWSGMAGSAGLAPENVTVSGGKLCLKSEQRTVSYGGSSKSYAAGEVSSFFNFSQQYGYFEARVKYPAVTGLWPAFWLMPDRGDYGWKDGYYRSYLKFDLTGVNPGTITTAELKVKVSSVESGTSNVVFMKLNNDSWSESTLTWNNKPEPDPVWITQQWNQAVAGQDMTVNVKDFVTQQMSGDKKISFVLADTFMKTVSVKFHSSEAATQADRPRLVINGVTYYASEDATVRWGTLANTNYGNDALLAVEDHWGDTATTFNGGMEVDIMESLGIWGSNVTQHAVHWDGYDTSHQTKGWSNIFYPATGDDFHTYGVNWQSGLLEFYVDGVRTGDWSNSRVMSVPAYLILSLQLGGWGGNNPGAQVNNQVMEVDWVRVWSGSRTGLEAVVVDNADTARVTESGTWTSSTSTAGYFGSNYVNDGNTAKGTRTFSFKPPVTTARNYKIYARWTSGTNRATNVPIDIVKSDGGISTVVVNQQAGGSQWNLLGTYALGASNAEVRIRTDSTNGYVIADAVYIVPAP